MLNSARSKKYTRSSLKNIDKNSLSYNSKEISKKASKKGQNYL